MSRKLEDLLGTVEVCARRMLSAMKEDKTLRNLGVTGIFVNETKRDLAVQMAYYSRGRMEPKDVRAMYNAAGLYTPTDAECRTPNTWTLQSAHLEGRALDIVPEVNGALNWNACKEIWEQLGRIGKDFGFVWGGDWAVKDLPHFEVPK